MKAVVIRHPGKGKDAWALTEKPDPRPGPGEVIVRMRAASLNYRDLMIARGRYGGPSKEDVVALSDGAGEIVAVGANADRWRVGDRVTSTYFPAWQKGPLREAARARQLGVGSSDGVLAQYAALPASGVVRIPDHLSFEQASTLPCAALTAWNALFETTSSQPGETLVVQGTGGVSLFAAQLGLAAGLRVIATSSREAKLARVRALGVADTIDYTAIPEWQDEVLRLTGGAGADHILDVGGGGTLARSLAGVRVGGRISVVGLLTGADLQIDPLPILFRGVRVDGVVVGSVAAHERMNRALERTRLAPVIDEVFSLADAGKALAKLEAAAHFGKIVIAID